MKKIELVFANEDGKSVRYSLDNPIEPVNPATVNAVMDTIIAENIFYTIGGELRTKKSARVVEQLVETIDLVD